MADGERKEYEARINELLAQLVREKRRLRNCLRLLSVHTGRVHGHDRLLKHYST